MLVEMEIKIIESPVRDAMYFYRTTIITVVKKLTSVAFFLVLAISLSGQDISGQWNGVLKVGAMQLRIVFNVTKTVAGYSTTMDSPDQGAYCIPVSTTTFENMVLKFEAPNLGIQYEGTLDPSNEISGSFR